ncbi:MAG: type I restriction endonuclease subunit R, partial [Lachnospira sp.]|nr:type I restriction endonuclease subunit R [Lachnospira sp.]
MEIKERRFEEDIESYMLSNGGYTKGSDATFDKEKGIDLTKLIKYIEATQPREWERYQKIYGSDSISKLYKRFDESVDMHGLLHVIRHGIEDRGIKLKFASFKPETSLNPAVIEKYNANIVECIRQFHYSTQNNNSIDMVLMLNGIPVVALELKNQLTGQSVENAKKQYMKDRDAKETCIGFNRRFLVYFAVDLFEVEMTTELKGKDTFFLPFNMGSNGAGNVGGAGNPVNEDGYTTSYLWEKVLQKDILLDILQRYMHLSVEEKIDTQTGKKKTSRKLIFPRYHQLDVVTKILVDVKGNGAGHNYLIQHSAGSGKSNSIAWLSYGLANLHDADDNKIFKSVIVVTDRNILDSQLQDTIYSFDHTEGVVEKIDEKKKSTDLRDAINAGKKIIITTLQKFPYIYQEVENNANKNFAVIIDEAH